VLFDIQQAQRYFLHSALIGVLSLKLGIAYVCMYMSMVDLPSFPRRFYLSAPRRPAPPCPFLFTASDNFKCLRCSFFNVAVLSNPSGCRCAETAWAFPSEWYCMNAEEAGQNSMLDGRCGGYVAP
jgi:hypothetical protein